MNKTTTLNNLVKLSTKNNLPSEQTIANILNYSKALSVRKSNSVGFLEIVLN